MTRRVERLNSSLKEVISHVIKREIRNPDVSSLLTVTGVSITKDLRHAKVNISVIGTDEEKSKTIDALNKAAGFIAVQSSKQIVIRHFPELVFKIDNSASDQMRIEEILYDIETERTSREPS